MSEPMKLVSICPHPEKCEQLAYEAEIAAGRAKPAASDLTRAKSIYGVIAAFGWSITWQHTKPIPDAWPIDIIAAALTEVRREGEIAMRERAVEIAKSYATCGCNGEHGPCMIDDPANAIAEDIAALPDSM